MNFENENAKQIYLNALKNMTPEQKLKKACELSDFTKMLFINGLKKRNPGLNTVDFNKLFVEKILKCSNSIF